MTASSARIRPPNRRTLIIDAARTLFHTQGYAHVSMADIAAAVNVGPSALYRHFSGKQELLAVVLAAESTDWARAVEAARTAPDPIAALTACALNHRGLGVLWTRESRHLDDSARLELSQGIEAIVQLMGDIVGGTDVTAWVVMSVLLSPSFRKLTLDEDSLIDLLGTMTRAASQVETDDVAPPPVLSMSRTRPLSRREQLLASSMDLFARQGFPAVGIEDIAANVGLTATGIYRHFSSKNDLLDAGINRGTDWVMLDLDRALARSVTPQDALRELVSSYISLVIDQPNVITVMLTEVGHLPVPEQRRFRQEQRNYVQEWVWLLNQVHPGEDAETARARTQAAMTIAHLCARNRYLLDNPLLRKHLESSCQAVLGIVP